MTAFEIAEKYHSCLSVQVLEVTCDGMKWWAAWKDGVCQGLTYCVAAGATVLVVHVDYVCSAQQTELTSRVSLSTPFVSPHCNVTLALGFSPARWNPYCRKSVKTLHHFFSIQKIHFDKAAAATYSCPPEPQPLPDLAFCCSFLPRIYVDQSSLRSITDLLPTLCYVMI